MKITADFSRSIGPVRPMHAVNNGPTKPRADQSRGNFNEWVEAGIPYARNHDAAFCADYGGEHTVDVHAIFPNFDADVNDPASYDFVLTDEYTQTILEGGTKVFYRLGSKIEHAKKKYGTLVPKDFNKWAQICEHIIAHYTEGWADGFEWDMPYWEIWNEPDLDPDDSPNKRCWGGTAKEFYAFYRVAALHLKKRFPHLKIGGPALANNTGAWMDGFLAAMTEGERVPLDFFSWHIYCTEPGKMAKRAKIVREKLDAAGYTETESICNEWNYIKGWGDEYIYSIEQINSMKGAAFTAACMLEMQNVGLDMLMYYDARVSTIFNGLFDVYTLRPRKAYYPFKMFSTLYKLKNAAACTAEGEGLYAAAAGNGEASAVMLCTYTDDDDDTALRSVQLELTGGAEEYEVWLLDEDNTMECIGKVAKNGTLPLPARSVVLLKGY